MSAAQVTEAHVRLANQLVSSPPSPLVLATLIADSEAKAVAEWQDFVHLKGEAIDSLLLECGRLRAELATERARLRQIALDACRSAKITPIVWYPKRYAIEPNDFGIINEQQVEACAQAIDVAMKEAA